MESIKFQRDAQKKLAANISGFTTVGQFLADNAVPSHIEQKILELPVYAALQQPLQDKTTGKPFFMVGYDTPGDPNRPLRP